EAALTWQTGFPCAVSLAGRFPESRPGSTSAESLLTRGEADAALVVAPGFPSGLTNEANERLRAIPTVVIGPKATQPGNSATVALDSATYGIDSPGTVMRSDGVVLTLRPPLKATVSSDLEWLGRIDDRLALGPDRGKSV
ncbi:formylmethanofuran dehydrogenase subunit B, partial [Singulisphaera rosea]